MTSLNSTATSKSKKADKSAEILNELIVDCIQDIKGKNIVLLDLRKLLDAPTDFFIICEGDSFVQVRSIADNIQKRLKDEMGIRPNHIEGAQKSQWVLVDYFSVVVHVFHKEIRAYYDLEELWGDADIIEYQNL